MSILSEPVLAGAPHLPHMVRFPSLHRLQVMCVAVAASTRSLVGLAEQDHNPQAISHGLPAAHVISTAHSPSDSMAEPHLVARFSLRRPREA